LSKNVSAALFNLARLSHRAIAFATAEAFSLSRIAILQSSALPRFRRPVMPPLRLLRGLRENLSGLARQLVRHRLAGGGSLGDGEVKTSAGLSDGAGDSGWQISAEDPDGRVLPFELGWLEWFLVRTGWQSQGANEDRNRASDD
jgi:hypothetical protein